ncbi:hypothetical protein PanWU01x14_152730 [Parasponia andersonii]|uniref:Uncharacterized protein n=1 Tax=Parasponia andersonii TaxID=3476 RepID=A0A2P5CHF1_PARAD|nr:hypothetical protein PanWU01x14_152730 [Parasponia andersonii]
MAIVADILEEFISRQQSIFGRGKVCKFESVRKMEPSTRWVPPVSGYKLDCTVALGPNGRLRYGVVAKGRLLWLRYLEELGLALWRLLK